MDRVGKSVVIVDLVRKTIDLFWRVRTGDVYSSVKYVYGFII